MRAVPLAKDAKSTAVEATVANCYAGTYPMSRFLYVYINHKPSTDLDPLRREFVRYMLSRSGQEVVVKDGYYPLTPRIVEDAMKKLGLSSTAVEANAPKK